MLQRQAEKSVHRPKRQNDFELKNFIFEKRGWKKVQRELWKDVEREVEGDDECLERINRKPKQTDSSG